MAQIAKQTIKQQRDAQRAEKVAAMKKKQASEKRKQRLGIAAAVVGGLAVLALVAVIIVTSITPKVDPADISIKGLKSFPNLTAVHVATTVDYEADYGMNPPAGGNHNGTWLNCGVYTEPVPNENAVHDLEHGAVWVTYNPDDVSADDATKLADSLPNSYITLSPYPDLPAPVVASAWGEQVQLDGIDDPRLQKFIDKFWKSADAPEPNALCTGGLDGAGKVG